MYEPYSVLRPLILIFLSGWIGIVAQPAEAQQTVTLSGRGDRRCRAGCLRRDRESGRPRLGSARRRTRMAPTASR